MRGLPAYLNFQAIITFINNLFQLPTKFKFFSSDQISKAQSGLICTLRKSSINPFFVIVKKSKGGHPKGSTADCCPLV